MPYFLFFANIKSKVNKIASSVLKIYKRILFDYENEKKDNIKYYCPFSFVFYFNLIKLTFIKLKSSFVFLVIFRSEISFSFNYFKYFYRNWGVITDIIFFHHLCLIVCEISTLDKIYYTKRKKIHARSKKSIYHLDTIFI